MRIPLAPCQRPDPGAGHRNGEDYALWLTQAALLVRVLWAPRRRLSPGPVHLAVVFVLKPPVREAAKLAGLFCAKRPDLDRYVHAVQDAITEAGNVWDDDNQVARLEAAKRYAYEGEPPSVLFEVEALPLLGPSPENAIRERAALGATSSKESGAPGIDDVAPLRAKAGR